MPAVGQAERRDADDLVADAHAARAVDAVVRVALDERVRALRLADPARVEEALLAPLHEVDDPLQLAVLVARAGHAAVGHHVVALADHERAAALHARAVQAAVGVVGEQHLEHAALLLARELRGRRTTMPSRATIVQAVSTPRIFSTSTRHMRQPANGVRSW